MTGSTARAVALIAAGCARDADDCRLLLDMLGVLQTLPQTTRRARQPRPPQANHRPGVRSYRSGCRCDPCKVENAAAQQRLRERGKADPSRADRAGHGKASTYKNHCCRCDDCRAAHAAYMAEYNTRKRSAA